MPVGTPVGMSQSTKIKFTIDGLPSEIILKAKENLDTFTIWTGPIPKINNGSGNVDDVDDDLDDEYKEAEFIGDDEAPVDIKDPDPISNTIEDNGSNKVNDTTVYNPPSGAGGGVNLPKGKNAYSHNETQGYNLIDSKWYGDILTSAKQHIDTPTFDVPLTKRGKLGCASWVSIVFYRAFGVHIKDGKPVVPVPKSIGKFGSTGTGELGGWFAQNPNMWIKIPWREGQPGDIINTTKGPKEHGHIGIVMDTKNADGSWNIASNSSYGFGNKNDPFGCGKMNYSIKKWQTVTDRNPSGTFCWRYKGPKLSVGQTA
jgi:hypothetical protein